MAQAQINQPMSLVLSTPLARFWYLNTVGHDPIHDFGKKSSNNGGLLKFKL